MSQTLLRNLFRMLYNLEFQGRQNKVRNTSYTSYIWNGNCFKLNKIIIIGINPVTLHLQRVMIHTWLQFVLDG